MDTKEAFEKHMRDQGIKPVGWLKDEYWEIWQASRAAIEIDLPEEMREVVADTLIHGRVMANDMLRDCSKAITSHGIRIKGKTE